MMALTTSTSDKESHAVLIPGAIWLNQSLWHLLPPNTSNLTFSPQCPTSTVLAHGWAVFLCCTSMCGYSTCQWIFLLNFCIYFGSSSKFFTISTPAGKVHSHLIWHSFCSSLYLWSCLYTWWRQFLSVDEPQPVGQASHKHVGTGQ